MARWERAATAPARLRPGLPILRDGSPDQALLLRLPASDGPASCNNGCQPCVTLALDDPSASFDADVAGRHVVLRDREAALQRELPARVRDLKQRGAAHVALLTNGRILVYERGAEALVRAGVDRFIVKLFGLAAAEHDAHTRVPGSYAQAEKGLRIAQSLGASVLITFPTPAAGTAAEQAAERAARIALAGALTGHDPVEMPEPEVESYGGEYVYDVMDVRAPFALPLWGASWFPMVHVNTGPACNIRCTYCNVHGGDDQRLFERAYVERLLDNAAAQILGGRRVGGAPSIDFIGGEPTLHPELPALIRHARQVGFEQVTICTNGVLLVRPGYLDTLVAAGLTGVRLSLHEHRAEAAGALAAVPEVGRAYPAAGELLLARDDVDVQIYRILVASNLDSLDDYVRWLVAHRKTKRVVRLVLGMPSMRGRMLEQPDLLPPLRDLRERVRRAMELARHEGFEPIVFHAPGCLWPEEPSRAACLHVDNAQIGALSGSVIAADSEGDTRFGAACERCEGRSMGCHGLPKPYFEQDADEAEQWLQPISYAPALLAPSDPARGAAGGEAGAEGADGL